MKLLTAFLFSLVGPVVSQETHVSPIRTGRELLACADLKTKKFKYGTNSTHFKKCFTIKWQQHRDKFCERKVINISEDPPEGYLLKDKGKVFCPKACWACGTPKCVDDKKHKFDKKSVKTKHCRQLSKMEKKEGGPEKILKICETEDENGVVKDFCRKTCNNCATANPTSSPTMIQPSFVPTSFRCSDHATFQFSIGSKDYTCASFGSSNMPETKKQKNCDKLHMMEGEKMQLRRICMDACGNCGSKSESPSESPTESPTNSPSLRPTEDPTLFPSKVPTSGPSKSPTDSSSLEPTEVPSSGPSKSPTDSSSLEPTEVPSSGPSKSPTDSSSLEPTEVPTYSPTDFTTESPTGSPTSSDLPTPTGGVPTESPTGGPTSSDLPTPTGGVPTESPTGGPTSSDLPTPTGGVPTESPTGVPTSTNPPE